MKAPVPESVGVKENGTRGAVNTADGPTSDAVIADIGSALLRHEHGVDFDFDGFAV